MRSDLGIPYPREYGALWQNGRVQVDDQIGPSPKRWCWSLHQNTRNSCVLCVRPKKLGIRALFAWRTSTIQPLPHCKLSVPGMLIGSYQGLPFDEAERKGRPASRPYSSMDEVPRVALSNSILAPYDKEFRSTSSRIGEVRSSPPII
jgi:hypothetical protein